MRTQRSDRGRTLAARADKHELYEQAVQETSADIRLIRRAFRRRNDREPESLREDFCGTAKLCADWVQRQPRRTAVGLDLDAETLAWGRKRHLAPLGAAQSRVVLLHRDVMQGTGRRFDVVAAFNFSYWILQTRAELCRYFSAARAELVGDGLFVLDIYGGPEAQRGLVEQRRLSGFTYVWEQGPVDAVSHRCQRTIHFRFKDGSRMRRAFVYDWRLWSLPEVIDALRDAGFAEVDVHWESADARGRGTGVFRTVTSVENEDAWVAYLCAWKS